MRRAPLLVVLLVLAACRGTQAYTPLDLKQVRHAYRQITPVYRSFRAAYLAGHTHVMLQEYAREQQVCPQVDPIDARDTIDPNTNLFAVSAGLDSLCNTIEYAYTNWAIIHHRPYDGALAPPTPGTPWPVQTPEDVFLNADLALKMMPKQMARPAAQA